uniref:lysoplasmalogenase n=1 Tax=Globodera rostochiensis TaxID=31243 RepID=A0A914I9R2_GLORO
MHKLVIYVLLIAFFYEQTGGFNEQLGFQYSFLKALPILCLALFVNFGWYSVKRTHRQRYLLVASLLAAAGGDFVISIRENIEPSFALSALFFAAAHILYMAFLLPFLRHPFVPLTLCCAAYVVVMNYAFLLPHVVTHPFSTLVLMTYSVVLTTAFIISGSLMFVGTHFQPPLQKSNVMHFVGFCFFYLSDTLLLLEHADVKFPPCYKEELILSTYYMSQYLIDLRESKCQLYLILTSGDKHSPFGTGSEGCWNCWTIGLALQKRRRISRLHFEHRPIFSGTSTAFNNEGKTGPCQNIVDYVPIANVRHLPPLSLCVLVAVLTSLCTQLAVFLLSCLWAALRKCFDRRRRNGTVVGSAASINRHQSDKLLCCTTTLTPTRKRRRGEGPKTTEGEADRAKTADCCGDKTWRRIIQVWR